MMSTQDPSKSAQNQGFRVLNLSHDAAPGNLQLGESLEIVKGVCLTARHASEEILIEIDGSIFASQVSVDKRPVVDVAVVRPRQMIRVGELRFVILRYFDAYIHTEANRTAHAALFARARTVDSNPTKPEAPGDRRRKLLRGTVALLALAIVSMLYLGTKEPIESVKESVVTVTPAEETNSRHTLSSSLSMLQDAEKPVATVPSAVPTPAETPKPDEQKVEATNPPPVESSPSKRGERIASSSKKGGDRSHPAYSLIQEYRLEARFDPEGARRKLKDLIKTLPAGSAVRGDAENTLQKL